MKLTYAQVTPLLRACLSLEQALIGKGSGEARLRLAANMKALRDHEDTHQTARNNLIREVAGDVATVPENSPQAAELSKRLMEMENTEIEVSLWSIDFKVLGKEKVSPQALSHAMPLIKGCEGWGEPDV